MSNRLWLVVFILALLAFCGVFIVYFLWFKAWLNFHYLKILKYGGNSVILLVVY